MAMLMCIPMNELEVIMFLLQRLWTHGVLSSQFVMIQYCINELKRYKRVDEQYKEKLLTM